MKKTSSIFISILINIYFMSVANANPKINDHFIYKVVYGENVSEFLVSKDKDQFQIDFQNQSGLKKSRKISKKDFFFLKDKILKLKDPTNNIRFCPRNYVQFTSGSRVLIGCLNSKNKLANELQDTSNMLALLF